MKKILLIFVALLLVNCTNEDYEALNKDPNNPTEVDAGQLFVAATIALFDQIESTNVNDNVFRLFSQYWTETTYTDEANYDLATRRVPGRHWNTLYRNVLFDLNDAKSKTDGDAFKNAQIEVLEVYTWQNLVDTFGDIPYSEALKGKKPDEIFQPKYDDAAGIYTDLLIRIDSAISTLSGSSGAGFGSSDLIYGNSRASWQKFANSLKLKLGIRLADADAVAAKKAVEDAVSGGVFTSNSDNAILKYESNKPNTNPLWEDLVESGRNDFVPANTLVDHLNTLGDPRRDVFFDPESKISGAYVGGTYGAQSAYGDHSHIGLALLNPSFRGVLMDYAEVSFNLAEAAERFWSVGGTSEEHYNNGVTANFKDWGLTAVDATAYLAKAEVAYTTAAGTWKEKIGLQYWIAMYNRGSEGWYVYRKFDAPKLNIAATAKIPVPKRFKYPIDEQSLNEANWNSATNDGKEDIYSKPLFWDKK